MTRHATLASATALVLAASACSVTTSGAQCKVDSNCQSGEYCAATSGQVGTCQECTCTAGLLCSGGAGPQPQCLCPVNMPSLSVWTFYADASAGTAQGTGVETPAQCRFPSIDAALSAANAKGPGSRAIATGASPSRSMIFQEAGPLAIGPGVSLTSSSPSAGSYLIAAPSATTSAPFITVSAGATLSGFQIQSGSFQGGNAIQSDCTESGTVSIRNVTVAGNGIGKGGFQAGVYHSGGCDLDLESSTISGVNDSAVLLATTSTSNVTLLNNVLTRNGATTTYQPLSQKGGGLVLSEQVPATLVASGNQFYGNAGDQVLVALASPAVTVSLVGGGDSSACGTTSNLIACYDTGFVGIFSNATSLLAEYNQWDVASPSAQNNPPDFFGTVDASPACPPETGLTCPPPP